MEKNKYVNSTGYMNSLVKRIFVGWEIFFLVGVANVSYPVSFL